MRQDVYKRQEETGKESYLPLLRQWADGVYHGMPRAGEGAIQHVVSGGQNEGQVWDDTLYMTVLFLARMGQLLGREDYVQEMCIRDRYIRC